MNNGVGPSWFPAPVRRALTWFSLLFFSEANWDKHDEGYKAGSPSRSECDRKMLQAGLRDASRTTTIPRIFVCTFLAWVYYLACRAGGWATYNYKGK